MARDKTRMMVSALLAAFCLAAAWAAEAGPLVIDKKIGHYKDLSYEALSDEGLS